MYYCKTVLICFVVSEVLLTAFSFDLLSKPEHTAALFGEDASINCSVTNIVTDPTLPLAERDVFTWTEFISSSTGFEIYHSENTDTCCVDRYSIEGTYNLVLLNVDGGHAGMYECKHLFKESLLKEAVEFVVLHPLSAWSQGVVAEGKDITLTCESEHFGNIAPQLKWVEDGLTIDAEEIEEREGFVKIQTNMTVYASDHNKKVECVRYFTPPYPVYQDNKTATISVLFSVRNIEISPEPVSGEVLSMPLGSVFTCHAEGGPEPQYLWTDDESDLEWLGNVLPVTAAMSFTYNRFSCTARNTVGEITSSISKDVTFKVVAEVSRASPPPSFKVLLSAICCIFYCWSRYKIMA